MARKYHRRKRHPRRPKGRKGYAPSRWNPTVSLAPDKIFVRLKFSESQPVLAGANVANLIYRANCHTDCNYLAQGIGSSAYGSGQWHTFYNKSYCPSSTIKVTFITLEAGGISEISLFPANSPFTSTSIDSAMQRSRNKGALITNQAAKRMYNSATTKGVTGQRWSAQDTYSTGITVTDFGAPQHDWFWHIAAKVVSGNVVNLLALVEIEYNVMFFDRRGVLGAAQEAPGNSGGGN